MARPDLQSQLEADLIRRWTDIEELENRDEVSETAEAEFRRTKEKWFLDAFKFIDRLPTEMHCWCHHSDITWPLLEPFHSFNDSDAVALKVLWKRMSLEMRHCINCVIQYHKAKDYYEAEFLEEVVKPLMALLQKLDNERVAGHLQDILEKVKSNSFKSHTDSVEVVCVMFEVLMFPALLEDSKVNDLFVPFFQYVSSTHDLCLSGDQRYPGLYALLFHSSQEVRRIAHGLANSLQPFQNVEDLEPIQPVLEKCMQQLENDMVNPKKQDSLKPMSKGTLDYFMRPNNGGTGGIGGTRESIWLGLQSMLGLLKSSAFEEGIVERYPGFVSIVLNHVSESTVVFWNALRCLKLLLEILGYKLWLRTTFSPGVMRNTLLSQCFHARDEKTHTAIFDLFQPFLQSLEALQDGEYERQRRRLLYFLLQQVPYSSNFSSLMSKKAWQVAFLIIGRGYGMHPALPPFECVHIWGPPLMKTFKDPRLHPSVRQPAVDLVEMIIVADAAVLAALWGKVQDQDNALDRNDQAVDDSDNGHVESEANLTCWTKFQSCSDLGENESGNWRCAPLIWQEALEQLTPTPLPDSFAKAVFWAVSRVSIVEQSNWSPEGDLLVLENGITCSQEISNALHWVKPKGCDDGADGICANGVKCKAHLAELMNFFKRCADVYVNRLQQSSLVQQWSWDPKMAESLTLLFISPSSDYRNLSKGILQHFTEGTTEDGLHCLCSTPAARTSTISGLSRAISLLLSRPLFEGCTCLPHLFFMALKFLTLLKEETTLYLDNKNTAGGGFLKEPTINMKSMETSSGEKRIDLRAWKGFCRKLSGILWPLLVKVLAFARKYPDVPSSDVPSHVMICTRELEILPVVLRFLPGPSVVADNNNPRALWGSHCGEWLQDLMAWGKLSSPTICRRWKEAVSLILDIIGSYGVCQSPFLKLALSQLLEHSDSRLDNEHQSQLRAIMLSQEKPQVLDLRDDELEICTPKQNMEIIDLDTDDEEEHKIKDEENVVKPTLEVTSYSNEQNAPSPYKGNIAAETYDSSVKDISPPTTTSQYKRPSVRKAPSIYKGPSTTSTLDRFLGKPQGGIASSNNRVPALGSRNQMISVRGSSLRGLKSQSKLASLRAEHHTDLQKLSLAESQVRAQVKERIGRNQIENASQGQHQHHCREEKAEDMMLKSKSLSPLESSLEENTIILEEIVADDGMDLLDMALDAAKKLPVISKPSMLHPKRQVIRLEMPGEQLRGSFPARSRGRLSQLAPPRLDDWYRRILSLDYFAVVGLHSNNEGGDTDALVKVPLSFRSHNEYIEVFRPLLLEEFKAQMHRAHEEMALSEGVTSGVLRLMSVERVDDFQHGRFMANAGTDNAARAVSENDLLLLTRQPLHGLSQGQNLHVIAKVERREKENKSRATILLLKMYFPASNSRLIKARRMLVDHSKWHMTRLMSITPQLREFQAVSSISTFPLLQTILCPSAFSNQKGPDTTVLRVLPESLQSKLNEEYNASQLSAIAAAIGKSGNTVVRHEISLVQGPPGTGKTRTIVAIISVLLALYKLGHNENNAPEMYADKTPGIKRIANAHAAIARSWQDAALAKQCMQEEGKGNARYSGNSGKRPRVLVCAQSNAAVDELVSRICKNGLYGVEGKFVRPSIVRVGNAKNIHPDSLPVYIDTLVENRLAIESRGSDNLLESGESNSLTLRANLEGVIESIQALEISRSHFKTGEKDSVEIGGIKDDDNEAALQAKLNNLYSERRKLCAELAVSESREKRNVENDKNKKQKIRKAIIREAEIVLTTLSGCGGDVYSICMESANEKKQITCNGFFDAVVIDEAAQALEPATLIPLQLLSDTQARCIMIGDPKQLTATVLSSAASKMSYECSMFERFQRNNFPVTMLSIQYRMHPEICRFPSAHFYDNQLTDGKDITNGCRTASFHKHRYFGPYVFFNVSEGQEKSGSSSFQSLCNLEEVEVVIHLMKSFWKRFPDEIKPGRIAVITPYKNQLMLLRDQVTRSLGPGLTSSIEFNTVDGFQGREVDILLLSTVRGSSGSQNSSIGFVADLRRMNVSLTRARFSLWIIGNAKTLKTNLAWAALLDDADKRGLIFPVKKPYNKVFQGSAVALDAQSVEIRNKGERMNEQISEKGAIKVISSPNDISCQGSQVAKPSSQVKSKPHVLKEKPRLSKHMIEAEQTIQGSQVTKASSQVKSRPQVLQEKLRVSKHIREAEQAMEEIEIHSDKQDSKSKRDLLPSEKQHHNMPRKASKINMVTQAGVGGRKTDGTVSVNQFCGMASQQKAPVRTNPDTSNACQGDIVSNASIKNNAALVRKRQREEAAAMMPSGSFLSSKKELPHRSQKASSISRLKEHASSKVQPIEENQTTSRSGKINDNGLQDEWEKFQKALDAKMR